MTAIFFTQCSVVKARLDGMLRTKYNKKENATKMKPGNNQEEQREREQINESGGGDRRMPDPGPQKRN